MAIIIIAPKALFRRWVPIQSLRFWDVRGMTLLCLFTLLYAFVSPPKPYCFSTASSWAARARSFALLYVRGLSREVVEILCYILCEYREIGASLEHVQISKRCISASFESCGLRFHRKINPGWEFRFLVVSNQYVYFRSRIAFGAPMLLRAGPSSNFEIY